MKSIKVIVKFFLTIFLIGQSSNTLCMDWGSPSSKGTELKWLFSSIKKKKHVEIKYDVPKEITEKDLEEFKKLEETNRKDYTQIPLITVVDYASKNRHPVLGELLKAKNLKTLCLYNKVLCKIISSPEKNNSLSKEKCYFTQTVLDASLTSIFNLVEYAEAKNSNANFPKEKLKKLCARKKNYFFMSSRDGKEVDLIIAINPIDTKKLNIKDIDHISQHACLEKKVDYEEIEILDEKDDFILQEFKKTIKMEKKL